jgi:hypothetical protein
MPCVDTLLLCAAQPANSGLFCKHAQVAELQYLTQNAARASEKRAKADPGRLPDLMHLWVDQSWHLETWEESLKGLPECSSVTKKFTVQCLRFRFGCFSRL